jgi:hypothetical protein
MARVQKSTDSSSLADVIDRILDRGIVIDVWVRVSLVGIELLTVEARVVIASVETYLRYADAIGQTALSAQPRIGAIGAAETAAAIGAERAAMAAERAVVAESVM